MALSFVDLLEQAERWVPSQNGFKVYLKLDSSKSYDKHDDQTQDITFSELALEHPQLPEAVTALFSWRKQNSIYSYADSHLVRCTLAVLRGDTQHFVGWDDTELVFLYTRHAKQSEVLPTCIGITGHDLHILTTSTGVPFVVSGTTIYHDVQKSHLHEHYPQWDLRWMVAEGMGLTGRELANYVFSNKALTTIVEMGAISF